MYSRILVWKFYLEEAIGHKLYKKLESDFDIKVKNIFKSGLREFYQITLNDMMLLRYMENQI